VWMADFLPDAMREPIAAMIDAGAEAMRNCC
jgi:hypothetical protein